MTEFYCQAQAQVSLALSGSLSGSGLQSGHDHGPSHVFRESDESLFKVTRKPDDKPQLSWS